MSRIEIISASAGSGKTHRLATLLEQELKAERVHPQGVLATTFTRRAAAELQSRARRHLLQAGRMDDAQELAAARIGTVNSVCGRLVSDFAFELGLSPDVRILDEIAAPLAFRRALTQVIESSPAAATLEEVAQRFDATRERGAEGKAWRRAASEPYDWREAVRDVVERARINCLGPERFAEFAERSIKELSELFAPRSGDPVKLDAALAKALAEFIKNAEASDDKTKDTVAALKLCKQILPQLRRKHRLRWSDWARLSKIETGAKSRQVFEPVRFAAKAHDHHPLLQDDLATLIRGVFTIAAQAVAAYAEYKRARGVMDFGDMEVQALELLGLPQVRKQLETELELVMVDEFQDTSPLQLSIFLKLAEIAPRSVWVGDQKQSIYGFRGADPSLMDAVIAAVVTDGKPETLSMSYRSRPQLVEICSEIFARAFEQQSIPAEQVRLTAALTEEPKGLGPIIERWELQTKNGPDDRKAIAGLVQDLLADEEVMVRDVHTKKVRRVRPGDVAILCQYNETCDGMAHALADRNVEATLRRSGLIETLEAQLVLAGLSVVVDPRGRLGAAQIVRLLQDNPVDTGWLEASLSKSDDDPLLAHPPVARLITACEAAPQTGPLGALDMVLDKLDVREQVLRWGHSAMRLANLDALRAHARRLVDRMTTEGQAATVSTLLDALTNAEGTDSQALLGDDAGVVISTWHASKGLEWPITILYEMDRGEKFHPFNVQIISDRRKFEFADPLGGRWLRFWPPPYGLAHKHTPCNERLEKHPALQLSMDMSAQETLRVMYVGFTRARDRIILAARPGALKVSQVDDLKGNPLIVEPSKSTTWAGVEVSGKTRAGGPREPLDADPEPGRAAVAKGPSTFHDAYLSPSAVEANGVAQAVHEIGPRIDLKGDADPQRLGEAIHGFFAADRLGLPMAQRLEIAAGLLKRWQVASYLDAEHVVSASTALGNWVEANFPGAAWRRELPLHQRLATGTIVRGAADLVLETADGYVVIDHKSFPGRRDDALAKAVSFAGQLDTYATALTAATDASSVRTFVHLPIAGLIAQVALSSRQHL